MKYKVKSCPFCRKYNLRYYKSDDGYFGYIACVSKNCGCEGPIFDSGDQNINAFRLKQLAIDAWNNRLRPMVTKSISIRTYSHDEKWQC